MDIRYIVLKGFKKLFNRCAVRNSKIDKTSKLDIGSIVSHSEMGRYSYIGEHTSMLYTKVGNFTSISNYCAIGGGSHTIDWVSTSPVFNNSKSILNIRLSNNTYNPFARTIIGNDVWIGSHCLIKSGVKIADGAVIGMGSVVTKDVGPYEIWGGNPAKFIRKRFDDETILSLCSLKWFEWDDEKIKKNACYMNEVKKFIEESGK